MFKRRASVFIITFILLLCSLPVSAGKARLPFTDVKNTWYKDAVTFCYINDIMEGTSDKIFDPSGTTTREQMMTVLV